MKHLGKYFFPAVLIFLVLAGAFTSYAVFRATDRQLRASLIGRVASMSAFIEADHLKKLSASPDDVGTKEYQDMKRRMVEAVSVNKDVRYVYLMAKDKEGVYFYGDSVDPTLTAEYSAPGDRYDEASPELSGIFETGKAIIEGPSSDKFGNWMSGLAPVKDASGKVIAVFGMDIAYSSYRAELIKITSIPVGVFLILIIIMCFGTYIRRREQSSLALKAELVSIASHDLRSPLTGIEWAVNTIAKTTEPSTQPNKLAHAVGATAAELRNTVNTLLQLAIEEKGIDTGLNREDVVLKTVLVEVITIFSLAAEARNVKLVIDESVPADASVNVDKEKFKRALSNLINNAVKYTKSGTTVTMTYQKTAEEQVVGVKDEGIGIPEADKVKVMQGFHRAANAAKSNIEGTGLGMILTRRIIEAHGGTLSFDSTENIGTTFYLHLPVKR